mgnify:CR=1 FL=1
MEPAQSGGQLLVLAQISLHDHVQFFSIDDGNKIVFDCNSLGLFEEEQFFAHGFQIGPDHVCQLPVSKPEIDAGSIAFVYAELFRQLDQLAGQAAVDIQEDPVLNLQ